jgi:hypothetical protein
MIIPVLAFSPAEILIPSLCAAESLPNLDEPPCLVFDIFLDIYIYIFFIIIC